MAKLYRVPAFPRRLGTPCPGDPTRLTGAADVGRVRLSGALWRIDGRVVYATLATRNEAQVGLAVEDSLGPGRLGAIAPQSRVARREETGE